MLIKRTTEEKRETNVLFGSFSTLVVEMDLVVEVSHFCSLLHIFLSLTNTSRTPVMHATANEIRKESLV